MTNRVMADVNGVCINSTEQSIIYPHFKINASKEPHLFIRQILKGDLVYSVPLVLNR